MTRGKRDAFAGVRLTAVLAFEACILVAGGVGAAEHGPPSVRGAPTVLAIDGGYVGSETCAGCHPDLYAEFKKSGHPYKVRITDGAVPDPLTDPISALLDATRPRVADLLNPNSETNVKVADPSGFLDWSAISYVIGGWGWKARWGVNDLVDDSATGFIWSSSVSSPTGAQFNVLAADPTLDPMGRRANWSTYGSATKKYSCASCHNTNGTTSVDAGCITPIPSGRSEPWASTGMDPLVQKGGFQSEWTFSGVQCEACHGPGEIHSGAPETNPMTVATTKEACGRCHIRAENTPGAGPECPGDSNPGIFLNGAKITGDYLGHHGQYSELVGLSDGVHRTLSCVDCHDPHMRSHQLTSSVAAALGITDNDQTAEARGAVRSCDSCHPGVTLRHDMGDIQCIDCHMAEATKSATSESPDGVWGRMGDVKTHVFAIDPAATTITRVNSVGVNVVTNALSVRYACGKCHDSSMGSYIGTVPMTLAQAQESAKNIHLPPPPSYPVTFGITVGSGNSLEVNVTAQVNCGGTCPDLTYDWNWGDATAHATTASASHTYAGAGSKSITLIVKLVSTGDTVGSTTRTVTLTVKDQPPVASATCTWDANLWRMSVLDASTDDNAVTKVGINFGDGSTVTYAPAGSSVNRTYVSAGVFSVTDTAYDAKPQTNVFTCATQATPAYFTLSGTVKNKLGTANLASATVQLYKGASIVKSTLTNASGAFTFGSLKPAANYTIKVVKSGYTFASPAYTAGQVGPSQAGIAINATNK